MTSQGQRFRRRALRRGYKVDEVDAFLDRVEATLQGEQVGPPVGAQEVHDVVFRVRFGGYDEWQVDLHLDRVERQLAELEDRGGRGAPAPDPMRDSLRGGLSAAKPGLGAAMSGGGMGGGPGMGGGMGGRMAPPTERLPAPPVRDDRFQQQPPQRGQMPPDPYGRYDEPTGYGQPQQPQLPQRPAAAPPPPAYDRDPRDPRGYDRGGYDTGSFEQPTGGFDGFEAGRHGKTDMTAEIRMPQREQQDPRGGYGGPPMSGPPMSGPPMGNAPMSGPPMGYGEPQQPQLPPPMGEPGGELHRVDQLRRTFQPRRFGSGYDPSQVDRLFEGILQAMTGRGPMPVPENDLDMLQFGLVPGGYFEAEVDAALREVKDILTRRR
ncbi:DivIVA domain-containing protein [Paractinoplanes lichenicola]|uniref:DivIVA domain-containing protein n=1 Tax=Paractinoplanes lichenicola TaxID=2802976 RepID=A0ABS1W673_9ACTN|nr:DivIVA domain-containing protein [Actinoplanes lichenicola]MBL7262053.1 DivIVA domain-containing protein [Actinoplanes lichenicola]